MHQLCDPGFLCVGDLPGGGGVPVEGVPSIGLLDHAVQAPGAGGRDAPAASVARIILGHRSPVITEIYAELDREKAIEVMEKIG